MKISSSAVLVFAGIVIAWPVSAEEANDSGFGKWRVAFGGAFNSRVDADIGMRNLPVPSMYQVPAGSTKAAALARALVRQYDGGGFIADDSLANGFDTENWRLPVSSYKGSGQFVLDNAYQEVIGSSFDVDRRDNSECCNQFGLSLEAARELWIHDEEEEHRWGVDFAAAFSYFFGRDIFSTHSSVIRTDSVRDGKIRTDVVDPATTYDYDQGWDHPVAGMYGYGNATRTYVSPALGFAGIGTPYDIGGPSHPVISTSTYNANGDYQELEMLFMLRPWYEITDWWRVFVQAGVGVSWGRFDTTVRLPDGSYDEDFSQWDCYGVAGLGTTFRYDDFTITADVLGRFLRDDLDVDGRYLKGSVDRADWGFRIMIGYEF